MIALKLLPVATPMFGVTNVGAVFSTTLPVPVLVVAPVPPRATPNVPVVTLEASIFGRSSALSIPPTVTKPLVSYVIFVAVPAVMGAFSSTLVSCSALP